MIALAVLGLLVLIALPNLRTVSPKKQRAQLVASLNRLLHRGWRGAITKQKKYEVRVDTTKNIVWLRADSGKKDRMDEPIIEDVTTSAGRVEFKLPRTFAIRNFYIGDQDEMRGVGGRATTEVWFFISPDGIAQRVIMNVVDRNDTRADRAGKRVGLVLNPFTVQFKEHGAFQKP